MAPAKSFILFLLAIAALSEVAMAFNIKLPTGTVLGFSHDKRSRNVLRVTEQDFHACNAANPIAEYKSGEDWIIFRQPGHYHFISGFPRDCEAGMKLPVEVVLRPSAPSSPRLTSFLMIISSLGSIFWLFNVRGGSSLLLGMLYPQQ